MALFVTATGSDVGKTVVCALMAHRYATHTAKVQPDLAYWKPIDTGIARDTRSDARRPPDDAIEARQSSDSQRFLRLARGYGRALPEAYRFAAAVAPHWAARQARAPIMFEALSDALWTHRKACAKLIVEGIGGALVPLTSHGETLADWLATQSMACVVVAHTGLGTLNHTLLTLEALRHRRIRVAGVVLSGPAHPDNRRSLAAFGKVVVIDSVPWMTPLNSASLAHHAVNFDTEGVLAPYLAQT